VLALGQDHTCGLVTGGRAKCWGIDIDGELGQASMLYHPSPVDMLDSPPTRLRMNFSDGLPGSYFTLTGENFPPGSLATISVNGSMLTDSQLTTEAGGFVVFLSTGGADEGVYQVNASVNPSASIFFRLDAANPLRSQEGGGQILDVPSGIGINNKLFIPMVSRKY
jgi:hypothetical protein